MDDCRTIVDRETAKHLINEQVMRYGFLCMGYDKPKRVGEIAPVAFNDPGLGNLVILGPSSASEFEYMWGFPSGSPDVIHFYKAMID